MSRKIIFKPSYWSYEDQIEENELDIHIGGQTADGKTVHLIVWNFKPYVYVELPAKKVAWTEEKCRILYNYLKKIIWPVCLENYEDHAKLCQKQILHYKKEALCLRILLPTHKSGIRLRWRLCGSKNFAIPNLAWFSPGDFQVHEHNIDPIIKFTATQKLNLSDWLTVIETIPEGEEATLPESRKFSTADIDMYCDWQDVEPVEVSRAPAKRPLPTFLSFDIECYSANPNAKLPDSSLESNVVFQIGCIVGKFKTLPLKKVLFSLQNPAEIAEVEIRRFERERDLLLGFAAFIRDVNPDIFIGYNIFGFDWPYLLARATVCGVLEQFKMIGRLLGIPAPIKQVKWSSGAYGEQNYDYPDAQGRIHIDVMKEVQREYRLSSYALNAVSDHFLGRRKDDITPRQLFMLYKGSVELKGKIADDNFPTAVRQILVKRFTHGKVQTLRSKLLKAQIPEKRLSLIRQLLKLVGSYCIQDTLLPILLCERLNLWETMEALSNCMSVPLAYLHSRGQQIKVLAQVYREILPLNMIIPFFPKTEVGVTERFQGAVVIDAHEGFYERVALLDFLSLYPTLIIAFNICYTTIVREGDPIPDKECHVLQWEDHVGCDHDTKKRKKKAGDILCQAKRYRFRRIKIGSDGSRLYEGVLPALERRLLTERGKIKKDLARVKAKLATSKDETEKTDLEISRNILDANQKALKVSANSAYGAMGARTGFMPLLIGAASVTAMGRKLITMAINHILSRYPTARLVYGDTDSCMIRFEGADVAESFRLAHLASRSATHYIKSSILNLPEDYKVNGKHLNDFNLSEVKLEDADHLAKLEYDSIPIDLEFEDMFGKYLLLTQKRYAGHVINIEGKKIKDVKKGIVLARRDNCALLKTIYGRLLDAVLESWPEDEILKSLYAEIEKIYTRQVADPQFIIYLAVNNVLSYAKTDSQGRFIMVDESPIIGYVDALDSRLVYPNLRQVMLALRMLKRGDSIPAGTRLEFVFVKRPGALYEGDRLEDFNFYRENRKGPTGFALDLNHYVEKQILKPVTELLNVAFPHKTISAVPIKDRLGGLDLDTLGEYQLCILKQKGALSSKVYHILQSAKRFDYVGITQCLEGVKLGSGNPCGCVLRYGGGTRNDINRAKHPQIVALCQDFFAWHLISRLKKQVGLPKSRARRKGLARGATEYPRDSNVVGDMLQARQWFRKVVVELNLYALHKFCNKGS